MSIVIEGVQESTVIIERVEPKVEVVVTAPVINEPKYTTYMVTSKPTYDISIVDSLGGFVILLAAVLVLLKISGSGFFGSLFRGIIALVGGGMLFVYSFGMAIL